LGAPDPDGERLLRAHFLLRRQLGHPVGDPIGFDDPMAAPWSLKRDVLSPLETGRQGWCRSTP
jgi:hypothetical protein